MRTCLLVSLLLTVNIQVSFASDKAVLNPLVGTWQWVNIKNGCEETYIFAADGSSHITSGAEVSIASYQIADKPSEKGFYKVTLKILEDKGGQDCSEEVNDSTGEEYTNYLQFHPSGNLYVACDKESTDSCVGPLNRAR